jgi:hypothetical protein
MPEVRRDLSAIYGWQCKKRQARQTVHEEPFLAEQAHRKKALVKNSLSRHSILQGRRLTLLFQFA